MIRVHKLAFKYANAKTSTLKDLSFSLEAGKVLALVGPSGGGKSTLLRLLSGLEAASSGEIYLEDTNITYLKPQARGIGMLFQDYALFPHLNVEKNILFGLPKAMAKEKKKILKDMLALIDLEGYEKRYPHQLSGGQQQRVALARALAPKPQVLLLDEPFSNLDADLLHQIRSQMFDIINHLKITTIMVTHNREDARLYADQTLTIKDGQLVDPCPRQ